MRIKPFTGKSVKQYGMTYHGQRHSKAKFLNWAKKFRIK